ncbi:unknown [Clostridium sp. CAG:575]|nr:unknown [Clostridium sp. CAG:575]
MKKIAIFAMLIVVIICGIFYMHINYKANYNNSKKANLEFEKYLNEEVYGIDLATVINRAVDSNERNEVEKNNKGKYQNNNKTSINISIKMLDNDSIYEMETIYNGGIQNFVKYYGNIKFKCTEIKYHDFTNKVKYMLFEQITQ